MSTLADAKADPAQGVCVGPFELDARVGVGGMGEVWRAHHVVESHRVAIKIIHEQWCQQDIHRLGFAREVRAVAGLVHHGIVEVHDHGILQAAHSPRPFLVMEYMQRGSLERLLPVMTWPLARSILLQICDALAHAHARGIVHRDLKPGNVLLGGEERVLVKLGDFGVAHALSGHVGVGEDENITAELDGSRSAGAGTPAYMPPEQLRGHWRDFGPWTDLYALGCLGWELVTGQTPFTADSIVKLATLHIYEEIPRLFPRFEVPPALERWLRRLLRKPPYERFLSAADASWALRQLGEDVVEPPVWSELEHDLQHHSALSISREKTLTLYPIEPEELDVDADTVQVPALAPSLATQAMLSMSELRSTTDLPSLRPPWPRDWRHGLEDEPLARRGLMRGSGMGLYGLREIPLIGRERERDVLWSGLSRAHVRGPQLLMVRGASGVGKSRLAEWLAVRAQELGCALAMRAIHSPVSSPADGLLRMIANHARCVGLPLHESTQRIFDVLRYSAPHIDAELLHQEASAVAALLANDGEDASQRVTPDERGLWSIVSNYFSYLSSRRCVIVWVDDAQWGASSLRFLRHLWRRDERDMEVLFVLTVRDDVLAERPAESTHLTHLAQVHGVESLDVQALSLSDHKVLIATLLGLEDELVQRIAERTLGNPLFAVQLIGDWIERGILIATDQGYELVAEASVELPDDLHALWRQRVGRLLAERFTGERARAARAALELAALLGQEVDAYEWEAVCLLAQLAVPDELVDTLIEQRLARQTAHGWALVHGMLRESLERVAHEAGRSRMLHGLCVEMLLTLYGEHAMGHAERVASHLVLAGREEEALAPLIDAAYHDQVSGQYERASEILMRYDLLTQKMGLSDTSLHVARARMQRVWLAWSRGGTSETLEHEVARLEQLASTHNWQEVLGECWRWRGLVARFATGLEESLAHLERAQMCYDAIQDREGVARCLLSMAVALRGLRRLEEAEQALVQAVELASTSDFFVLLPRCFGNLAEVALQKGELDRASERFERARRVAEDVGDRKAMAFAIGGQGELAMVRGEYEQSYALWSRAEAIFDAVGSSYARVARVQLAAVHVMRGQSDEACQRVERVWEAGPLRDPTAAALAHMVMLARLADAAQFDQWEHHTSSLLELVARHDEPRQSLGILAHHIRATLEEIGESARALEIAAVANLT